MTSFIPGFIMGFREGLEAFLVVSIILQYLSHIQKNEYKKYVMYGALSGVVSSILFGAVLFYLSSLIQKTDEVSKLWESGTSLIALVLITSFIYWMMKHSKTMVDDIHKQVENRFSKVGLISIAFIMVTREGAEIAIFSFAGKYTLLSIIAGVGLAFVFAILIYKSLVKVNLKTLFNMTLVYLILQAGFLFGYAIHEGLSAFKALNMLSPDSWLLIKAFDLSNTVLNHKEGIIGLPLYVVFGWYSKPEWIQFVLQYGYITSLFVIWKKKNF